MSYRNEYFLQSVPFKIIWAGFESDTLTLQKNGWSLAIEDRAEFILDRHELRFILKHEMLNLICVTNFNTFEFQDLIGFSREHYEHIRFSVGVIAKDVIYTPLPEFRTENISEIDCRPEYIEINPKSIHELSIFKTLIKPDNELIIEPHRVGELLQKIVEAQAPNQKEIRERMRKFDARESYKQTLHAQILTVAA